MSKQAAKKEGDECSTETYGEDCEAQGGACAADLFAGPGSDEWGPKARARLAGNGVSAAKKGDKELIRRVHQLEKELLDRKVRGRKPTKSRKKKPVRVESPSDSSDDDESSRSTLPSDSSSSSSDRGRRSPSPKTEKRGKYDRRRQTKKGDNLKNSISILVYLIKLLRTSCKKGKRVRGLIDHLLVMAAKPESGYYKMEFHVGYDDDCREIASEKGVRAAAVLKFLSYDSTIVAKRQGPQQSQGQKQEGKGYCFKFNAAGCSSTRCQFRHICMFCGDGSHGGQSCKRGRAAPSAGASRAN